MADELPDRPGRRADGLLGRVEFARRRSTVFHLYPFLFRAADFDSCVAAIGEARWPDSRGRDPILLWRRSPFGHEDAVLAHVGRHLQPEDGAEPVAARPSARAWALTDPALQSHSTLGMSGGVEWSLEMTGRPPLPFTPAGLDLMLFQLGVGLLVIEARPASDRLDDWLDFVHAFRFIQGQRGVRVWARRRRASPDGRPEAGPYWPPTAGGLEARPEGRGRIDDILTALLDASGPAMRHGRAWWRRDASGSDQMVPYAILFADGVPEDAEGALLHRLRNCFHSREDVRPLEHGAGPEARHTLLYAAHQWFFFALEGGGFLACNPPAGPFSETTLPGRLRGVYRFTFLFSWYQRLFLLSLSERVAESWPRGGARARRQTFGEIRDALLAFTAGGQFGHLMRQSPHQVSYARWREVLETDGLFAEVRDEVSEMHGALVEERARRLEQRVGIVGVVLGVPAMVSAVVTTNVLGVTDWLRSAPWPEVSLLGAALLLVVALLIALVNHT